MPFYTTKYTHQNTVTAAVHEIQREPPCSKCVVKYYHVITVNRHCKVLTISNFFFPEDRGVEVNEDPLDTSVAQCYSTRTIQPSRGLIEDMNNYIG